LMTICINEHYHCTEHKGLTNKTILKVTNTDFISLNVNQLL
jgi:hypothetical protein